MSVLVFDTETTGIPDRSAADKYGPHQPRITEIAWLFSDDYGGMLSQGSVLINSGHVPGREVRELTGITDKLLIEAGVTPLEALHFFRAIWQRATTVASYNFNFDRRMLKNECVCISAATDWLDETPFTQRICLLKESRNAIRASRWINLSVAHQELVGEPYVATHRAMADTQAASRIFWRLKKNGHVHI